MTISELYEEWYRSPHYFNGDCSAFYQHMPTLRLLCHSKSVLELGVRYGVSTLAILASMPYELISVDIQRFDTIAQLEELARQEHISFTFYEHDDLTFIPFFQEKEDEQFLDVDVLFIDTLHSYEQLSKELEVYHEYVTEYIVMHDTVSFGNRNEDNSAGAQGLLPAIQEFLDKHTEWEIATHYHNCNGLMILRRKAW